MTDHEAGRRRLADLPMDEAVARLRAGVWLLLPFGAVEAHGPHLGLGTDLIDAVHVCRAVAERVDGLVAPAVPYAVCRTMRNLPGTVSLSVATFTALVRELVTEYVRHGARRLALYSGHAEPAQLEALREAVLEPVSGAAAPTVVVLGPYAFLESVRREAGLEGRDGHAASVETSTLLVLDPTTVRLDRIPAVSARPPISQFHVLGRPETEFPTGVRGDTSKVSRELGERAFGHVVSEFAALLERTARQGREW